MATCPPNSLGHGSSISSHIFVGLSVVATSVGAIVAWAEAKGAERAKAKGKMKDDVHKTVRDLAFSLLKFLSLLLFVLGIGATWYCLVEEASMLDGFYWACITSSTVGYGVLPISDATRTFNCVYLIVSVTTVAFCLGKIVELIAAIDLKHRVNEFSTQPLSVALIEEIEANRSTRNKREKNGMITHNEFLLFALTQMGRVSQSDIDEVEALFLRYDADGNGVIDARDIDYINTLEAQGTDGAKGYLSTASAVRPIHGGAGEVKSQPGDWDGD